MNKVIKMIAVLIVNAILIGCAQDLNPKPKFKHISGDNEGIICLKRSTKKELIYDIVPKDRSKNYYVDSYQKGNRFYIYSLVKDNNRSSMPWDTLIPGIPNTLYVSGDYSNIEIYWGDSYLDNLSVKERVCFRKDGSSVDRLNKEYYKEKATESVMESLVQSFYENLLSLPTN